MDREDNSLFSHNLMKKICIVLYFILLIGVVVSLIWRFYLYVNLYKDDVEGFIIFIFILSFFLSPFVVLIIVYPLYAIAYIADKNRQILKEQQVVHYLLIKITAIEQDNNAMNKELLKEAKAKNNEEEKKEVTE
jgi:Na+-transporting NADH:ubiquinone oxidoreductase subunit NqrC